MTDAESMPIESTTFTSLATKGAFSPMAIYSTAQVKDIIAYAKARGIRVMPVRVQLYASRLILQQNRRDLLICCLCVHHRNLTCR